MLTETIWRTDGGDPWGDFGEVALFERALPPLAAKSARPAFGPGNGDAEPSRRSRATSPEAGRTETRGVARVGALHRRGGFCTGPAGPNRRPFRGIEL